MEARGLHQAILNPRPTLSRHLHRHKCCSSIPKKATAGLGLFPAACCAPYEAMVDDKGNKLKVPHMGWNEVHQAMEHPLWAGIVDGSRFYFVHSYYCEPANPDLVAGFTHYPFPFTSAVARDNIFAVQLHPEKSAAAGLTLLGNFVMWDGTAASAESCTSSACM